MKQDMTRLHRSEVGTWPDEEASFPSLAENGPDRVYGFVSIAREDGMKQIETDYEKIDWVGVEDDFRNKLRLLQIAWKASQHGCTKTVHEQAVRDLYLPAMTKIAEFCACMEDLEEEVEDG
jgi:hypothetical protein